MKKTHFENVDVSKGLSSDKKPEANKTFFLTVYGPSSLETITLKPKWFEFWKKLVEHERTVAGQIMYNFIYPNTSFQIIRYDNDEMDIELMGTPLQIKDEHIGLEDCHVVIDVTDEPFITRAGQVISLNYHVLRMECSYAKIVSRNKIGCQFKDLNIRVGLPQR